MKLFIFAGGDTTGDSQSFEGVVIAESESDAFKILEEAGTPSHDQPKLAVEVAAGVVVDIGSYYQIDANIRK